MDFRAIARVALATETAIEINNSKSALGRAPDALTRELIRTVEEVGWRVIVNSGAHALDELGRDDAVEPLLQEVASLTRVSPFQAARRARQAGSRSVFPARASD